LSNHLKNVEKRISQLETSLAAAAHVDTIVEARAVFEALRNDAHVMRVFRADRDELEFLLRRQKDMKAAAEATDGR